MMVRCPHCGHVFSVPDKGPDEFYKAVKIVDCPHCGNSVTVSE